MRGCVALLGIPLMVDSKDPRAVLIATSTALGSQMAQLCATSCRSVVQLAWRLAVVSLPLPAPSFSSDSSKSSKSSRRKRRSSPAASQTMSLPQTREAYALASSLTALAHSAAPPVIHVAAQFALAPYGGWFRPCFQETVSSPSYKSSAEWKRLEEARHHVLRRLRETKANPSMKEQNLLIYDELKKVHHQLYLIRESYRSRDANDVSPPPSLIPSPSPSRRESCSRISPISPVEAADAKQPPRPRASTPYQAKEKPSNARPADCSDSKRAKTRRGRSRKKRKNVVARVAGGVSSLSPLAKRVCVASTSPRASPPRPGSLSPRIINFAEAKADGN